MLSIVAFCDGCNQLTRINAKTLKQAHDIIIQKWVEKSVMMDEGNITKQIFCISCAKKLYILTECPGEAHAFKCRENNFCLLCSPRWGFVPARVNETLSLREVRVKTLRQLK